MKEDNIHIYSLNYLTHRSARFEEDPSTYIKKKYDKRKINQPNFFVLFFLQTWTPESANKISQFFQRQTSPEC